MSQPSYGNPPPSGGGGSSVLVIVLIILAVIGLLCAGVCGGCYLLAQRAAQQIGAEVLLYGTHFRAAGAVRRDQEVIDKLGGDVETGEMKNQKIDMTPGNNKASFDFDVTGPNGTATAHVEASQTGDQWKINVLNVRFADGSVVDVDPNPGFNMGEMNDGMDDADFPNFRDDSFNFNSSPDDETE